MFVETVRIESLANNSYVVGSEQSGRCIVIDPARDVDQYVQISANHGQPRPTTALASSTPLRPTCTTTLYPEPGN
jgi:hypothetical protein